MVTSDAVGSAADPHRSVLERADAILAAFDEEHVDLSLAGVIARTGLPKTTVHRSVHKMVNLEWIELHDGRYSIGTRLFEYAALSRARVVLREAALPVMQSLRAGTRDTIHLAVIHGDQVIYLEKLPGRAPVANLTRVGARLPAYCTGLGKVMMAFSDPRPKDQLPAERAARTRHSIISCLRMSAELARIRDEGVAYDREECTLGVECVAAPVRAADRTCAGAISITVPARKLRLRQLAPVIRDAAADVSRALLAAA